MVSFQKQSKQRKVCNTNKAGWWLLYVEEEFKLLINLSCSTIIGIDVTTTVIKPLPQMYTSYMIARSFLMSLTSSNSMRLPLMFKPSDQPMRRINISLKLWAVFHYLPLLLQFHHRSLIGWRGCGWACGFLTNFSPRRRFAADSISKIHCRRPSKWARRRIHRTRAVMKNEKCVFSQRHLVSIRAIS